MATQTDSDCYGDDDVDVGGGDYGVPMPLLMTSGISPETVQFHGESMPQLLDLGVLWALYDVRPVHIIRPTRRRVLHHRGRLYSCEGERYVALRKRALNLMMRMMMVHVDSALSNASNKMILQEGNATVVRRN